MPSNRFIAREDDVLDLETGIRYSTADDAEAVADLLNTTPPQPVSGDVEAAARKAVAARRAVLDAVTPGHPNALNKENDPDGFGYNARFSAWHAATAALAAALASPEPESVVLEGQASNHVNDHDQKKYRTPYVCIEIGGDDYVEINTPELIERINDGRYKVTITPIKEN